MIRRNEFTKLKNGYELQYFVRIGSNYLAVSFCGSFGLQSQS